MDEDEADADPEPYDCDACPVADALAELETDQANVRAWSLFRQCCSRFTFDAHVVGVVYQRMTGELSAEEFIDLTARFALLYDTLHPPKGKDD